MRAVFAALIFACTIPAPAQDPLKLSFVSENQQIVPGKTFSVGLFQQMEKGYHSYWRNPGTVGMGMTVNWELPQGFEAAEIQWPTPEIGKMAVYDIWGYHEQAFLVLDIQAPAGLKPGTKVTLKGTAIWMCCGESCFPGNEKISLTLPVAVTTQPDPRWTSHFARTRAQQPVKAEGWELACSSAKDRYQLSIAAVDDNTQLPKNIRFFDYDRQISSEKGQEVKQRRRRAILQMHAEEHTGEKLSRLRGILVADTEWQPGVKVMAVDIPIRR